MQIFRCSYSINIGAIHYFQWKRLKKENIVNEYYLYDKYISIDL